MPILLANITKHKYNVLKSLLKLCQLKYYGLNGNKTT